MFVKIDTRQDFRILRPIIQPIHANMADELRETILQNMDIPPHHLILEMDEIPDWNSKLVEMLQDMQILAHKKSYSFFISGIKDQFNIELNKIPAFKNLNKVPTLAEAIDMVMMEKLEREFLEGEE